MGWMFLKQHIMTQKSKVWKCVGEAWNSMEKHVRACSNSTIKKHVPYTQHTQRW